MATLGVTDMRKRPKPIVLLVLDGWGLSPAWAGNAITGAEPPTFNYLWKHYPHAVLQAFKQVPNQKGVIGSSEIGHASIGTGRVVAQDLTEINLAIESGVFFASPALKAAFARARQKEKAVHLIGLLSEGGIHGSITHAKALVQMAKREGVSKLWVHLITDGRDVETNSALEYLKDFEATLRASGVGSIATVLGRNCAMDRDGRWDRIGTAYDALVHGSERVAYSAEEAISTAYRDGFDDEHIAPTVVGNSKPETLNSKHDRFVEGRVQPGDSVIFWNFRADRARQLTQAFLDKKAFRRFPFGRTHPLLDDLAFVSLTDYHLTLPGLTVAFPSAVIEPNLGQLLANHHLTQLRVAESEKTAHVTYFFNGGRQEPYEGEDRLIVKSPRVESYETVPAMSAGAITRILEREIRSRTHDVVIANYANVDMLAHTGNLDATGKAVLVVDEAIRRVANTVLDVGGTLLITADHGNAESVTTIKEGDRATLHTLNPVPFLYVTPTAKRDERDAGRPGTSLLKQLVASPHTLADVAPTILEILGIPKPSDMTGTSLLDKLE